MAINLSLKGAEFIQNFEGFRTIPYKDSGGLWTVGYGQQINSFQATKWQNGISKEEAEQLFDSFVSGLTRQLSKCPLANLFQYQQDAIISLSYNIGFEEFSKSTIYKHITIRDDDLISWRDYVYDAQKHLDEGLVRRRNLELRLFIYGIYF